MSFLPRPPLSSCSRVIGHVLSNAFPCKLHFPDSHHLASGRNQPMEDTRRLEGRMEGETSAFLTLFLCHGEGTSRSHCISSTIPAPNCQDDPPKSWPPQCRTPPCPTPLLPAPQNYHCGSTTSSLVPLARGGSNCFLYLLICVASPSPVWLFNSSKHSVSHFL